MDSLHQVFSLMKSQTIPPTALLGSGPSYGSRVGTQNFRALRPIALFKKQAQQPVSEPIPKPATLCHSFPPKL